MAMEMRKLMEANIRLLDRTGMAVYYLRTQAYEMALKTIADSAEDMKRLAEAVVNNRAYFKGIQPDSVMEMLENILEAQKKKDYVLLADLYELQLERFLLFLQEYMLTREEFLLNARLYEKNADFLEKENPELGEKLKEAFDARQLLEKGYFVEYASCGLMTMAALCHGDKYYFHSNSQIEGEAFLLAKSWAQEGVAAYHVLGLGFGYHVRKLREICPKAQIYVYETNLDIIRLACSFIEIGKEFQEDRIHLVYDPELTKWEEMKADSREEQSMPPAKRVLHYPSCRNMSCELQEKIKKDFPWFCFVEEY